VKKRIFIAIDLSHGVRKLVADHSARLHKLHPNLRISWTKPGNLHLTLKFLGNVEITSISEVCQALGRHIAEFPAFNVAISRTGIFPSARRPKVLWLGIDDPSGELHHLAAAIENIASKLGIPREDREFSPHLTIGRIRERATASALVQQHIETELDSHKFAVTEVVVYESELSTGGSIYTPMCTVQLR
jgi:RNA 2',3'-cyclic 3'-phosphodiesterase